MRGNLHVMQALAACGLLVVCVMLQPRHKEVALFQRSAGSRALAADNRQSRATLQTLTADSVSPEALGESDGVDDTDPPPQDILAIQGAQAGSIMGLDYMETSAAATAAAAAAAAPELIPLMALRQRYPQLRTVDAPFRLAGYTVPGSSYDGTQPSADPWTGDPSLMRVMTKGHASSSSSASSPSSPSSDATEADYGKRRSAAQAGEVQRAARGPQSLYYKADEQQARDAYLARHPRQAQMVYTYHLHVYIHTYTYIHTYMCIHTYTHTHTHTHTHRRRRRRRTTRRGRRATRSSLFTTKQQGSRRATRTLYQRCVTYEEEDACRSCVIYDKGV